jgi:RNA-binding protein
MAELTLTQETCLALRAQAHNLDAVVLLGAAGLSEAALREIDRALSAHGLVKVRAGKLERDARDALYGTMAERLGAARVQAIGHTFVLFRPIPPAPAAARRTAPGKPGSKARRQAQARPVRTAPTPSAARAAARAPAKSAAKPYARASAGTVARPSTRAVPARTRRPAGGRAR